MRTDDLIAHVESVAGPLREQLQVAEARVAELEAVLEEAEIEVAVAAQRLHFEDALATDRADELAELSERLRAALKGQQAK
jgi:hypothetical protein